MQPKRIFIAATRQNDGKTVVSLGLMRVLQKRYARVGFMKPVGQKYMVVDGEKVDKDAVLVRNVCGLEDALRDINPIAVEEGFTRKYLDAPSPDVLIKKVRDSYERICRDKDVVVVEGTGHAGVGSVFDLSNAEVAGQLNTPVVLISIGGIGRPIDEIALNAPLFEKKSVSIKGIIVNKILPEKKPVVETYLNRGLEKMGKKLFGLLPYTPLLSQPTMRQIYEVLGARIIAGENKLDRKVENFIVGAMTPRHFLDYLKPHSLLVTPGDREDLILAALSQGAIPDQPSDFVTGIVLTGGLQPHKVILDLVKKAEMPTAVSSGDTYEVASDIHEVVVKIRETDTDKIEMAERLVEEHIDIERLLS